MPRFTSVMTAIPYVNSTPHIGNVLTTLSGDVTARYLRMREPNVWFQSGTDENGLKIKEAAEAAGEEPAVFVAKIAQRFIDIFDALGISYDDFVRTTEDRHIVASQKLFSQLQEKGYIYEGTYEGWYDVSTETFFREEDLVDGKSPDGNEVRWVSEKNYFFKLSAFQDKLLEAYGNGSLRVVPETRQNEVLSFIKQGLRDICISRTNPDWGISVPGDPTKVIYVWFDAVINYLTSTGYPADGYQDKWPPVVQWVGKDILTRFHATLWPAMLWGIGLEPAPIIAAHGWILLGTEKLSKSSGVVIRPLELRDELASKAGISPALAVDAIRYYLISTMTFESDSTFTYEDFYRRFNTDLANDLGNALNRSLSMAHKFVGGVIPDAPIEEAVQEACLSAKSGFERAMADFRLDHAVSHAMGLVSFLNKYIDTRAPWALAKNQDPALGAVMRSMLFTLHTAAALLSPVLPVACQSVVDQLGTQPTNNWDEVGDPASVPAGLPVGQPQPIFPRLDLKAIMSETPATPVVAAAPTAAPAPAEPLDIADFMKVQLRVGRVVEAEAVEKSDKLVKLQVDLGTETRQILAGIRKSYQPVDLIGRQVIVVANLKPAKLMGHESQGMLLAATDAEGAAILLQPERETPEGAGVK